MWHRSKFTPCPFACDQSSQCDPKGQFDGIVAWVLNGQHVQCFKKLLSLAQIRKPCHKAQLRSRVLHVDTRTFVQVVRLKDLGTTAMMIAAGNKARAGSAPSKASLTIPCEQPPKPPSGDLKGH
eukprot:s831_g16.t1